jgi:hypothetical protein
MEVKPMSTEIQSQHQIRTQHKNMGKVAVQVLSSLHLDSSVNWSHWEGSVLKPFLQLCLTLPPLPQPYSEEHWS